MADGFIVRKGGVAEEVLRTTAPSINFVSKTFSQIVVTFTNNDAAEAEVYYGITSTLTDTVTLAAAATSSNITFSGLDDDTAFTISAYALVTDPTSKKIKSEIVTTVITTDAIIFTAATGGTTLEYDSGGKRFRSHTFTSNGNFVVSTVGNGDRNQVDYLIIAGGAAGGGSTFSNRGASGGGAGGFLTTIAPVPSGGSLDAKPIITATTFEITVGGGGAGGTGNGQNGVNSSAFNITPTGGGGGSVNAGLNGGSGGGGGGQGSQLGGAGIIGQGRNGGSTAHVTVGNRGAGGGGGAGGVGGGVASQVNTGGNGGAGLGNILRTGSNETRATGGRGSDGNSTSTVNGAANTGNGGTGSQSFNTSGAGGSGIVVIRYEIAPTV